VCNKFGEILQILHKENLEPILNKYETTKLLREAASSWHYRRQLSYKLGKGKFVVAVYEKLVRFTMPLDHENLLLLSLDNFENISELVDNIQKIKNSNSD